MLTSRHIYKNFDDQKKGLQPRILSRLIILRFLSHSHQIFQFYSAISNIFATFYKNQSFLNLTKIYDGTPETHTIFLSYIIILKTAIQTIGTILNYILQNYQVRIK